MAGYSINQVGATGDKPFTMPGMTPVKNTLGFGGITPTPQSKALTNFSLNSNPTAPIKKQVVTTAGGDTHEIHYDNTPVNKAPSTQPDKFAGVDQTLGNINGLLAKYQSEQAKPAQNNQSTSSTYGGLINQGANASQDAYKTGSKNYQDFTSKAESAYKKAADTNQIIAKSESDVLHNPNYSLDTGIGRAGQIQQNYGQQGANANAVATGFGNLANSGISSQGQGISGLGNNAGLLSPRSDIIMRDPTTGAVIGNQNLQELAKLKGNLSGVESGAASAAGATGNAIADLTAKYQQGQAQLRAASNLEPQIVQTLNSNPTLNQTPISAITNLNQWFAGQTSDPAQQQLASQVAAYVAALGFSPEQATAIATQKGGTIGTLLKTLKANATAQTEANNPTNVTSGGTNQSSTGSSVEINPNGTLKAVSF